MPGCSFALPRGGAPLGVLLPDGSRLDFGLPPLHLAVREMSAASFEVVDVESLRAHYANTLAHWSRRLEDRREDAARIVGDRTLRIWRIYLAGCSHGFKQGWVSIHQLLGSVQPCPGPTGLPLTRDWMYRP